MTRRIVIYDDGPQGPQPGARAASRLIALVLTLAMVWAVLAVLGKAPSFDLGETDTAEAQDASSPAASQILKEARRFDDLGYKWGGGHNPKQWVANYKAGSRAGLDCSGLVDVAVYIVTDGKVNSSQVAEGFQRDKHWKNIGYKSDLRNATAGDIVWRNPGYRGPIGHVGIVISNNVNAKKVEIIEAKSSKLPYNDQIRIATYPYSEFQGASRFNYKG